MQNHILILMGAGGVAMIAAVACYIKNTERFVFPIVLALIGVFLMAANVVKAELPGGIKIEMQKLAEASSEVAEAVTLASQKNSEAIVAINAQLTASQEAFEAYQEQVNARFARLNQRPVTLPSALQFDRSRSLVQQRIEAANNANEEAVTKTDTLKDIAENALARD